MLSTRTGSISDSSTAHETARYYENEQTMASYYGRTGQVVAAPAIAERLGLNPDKPIAAEQVAQLMRGKRADGRKVAGRTERSSNLDGKRERTGFIDATWSAGKTFSAAVALAETPEERARLIAIHQNAVAEGMQYFEQHMGVARRGRGGRHGLERGELAYVAFDHFVSRPAYEGALPEPQTHTHCITPNVVLTESGHVGSMDLARLRHFTKEAGAVYQAVLSAGLQREGVAVSRGRNGETVLTDLVSVADLYSSRRDESERKARATAAKEGLSWESLSEREQVIRRRHAMLNGRMAKQHGEPPEHEWKRRAAEHGYQHRSVFRHRERAPPAGAALRHQGAGSAAAELLAKEFEHEAVLHIGKVREIIARAYVATGGMLHPRTDIDATLGLLRERGIERTALEFIGDKVTTRLGIEEEREAISLARELHQAGRLTAEVGSAGSGKSFRLARKADQWRLEGREIFAAALAWRQASDFADAGIDQQHRAALAPALHRIERGEWQLGRKSVLAVDELGLIGTQQLLGVLRVARDTGCSVHLAGDDKQCRSPAAGLPLDLLRRAGVDLPEWTQNYRQRGDRAQETASLWRKGKTAEALERMREDGDLIMIRGGREATIEHAAKQADGRLIMAPTNADARDLGAAVRKVRQERGELGRDLVVVDAIDRSGERYSVRIAQHDRIRLFDRVFDADLGRKRHLASNGDIVTVQRADARGMEIRNADGVTGTIRWDAIRDQDTSRIRIAPGWAATIHTSQGANVENARLVLLDGTRGMDLPRVYTALTRQRGNVQLVVNAAAEREMAAMRRPIGERGPVSPAEAMELTARNLAREDKPELASDIAAHISAEVARGQAIEGRRQREREREREWER